MYKNGGLLAGILAVLMLAGLSGAFALWSETLTISSIEVNSGELDWEIVGNSWQWKDACYLPDDGNTEATIEPSGDDWNLYPQGSPPFSAPYNWAGMDPVRTTKDVGCTDVTPSDSDGDGDIDTLIVELFNTYPFYYTQVTFDARNNGSIPLKIAQVWFDINCDGTIDAGPFNELNQNIVEDQGVYLDFDGDGFGDVLVWWGDNFGVQLEPLEDASMGLDIVVLQEAGENQEYRFCVNVQAVQWNEYDAVVGP